MDIVETRMLNSPRILAFSPPILRPHLETSVPVLDGLATGRAGGGGGSTVR